MAENLKDNNTSETEKPKIKIKKRYLIGGIALALIIGTVSLVCFNPVVKNWVHKLTMSETEYFRAVEKESFSSTAELTANAYSAVLYSFFGNQNYLLNGNIEISPEYAKNNNLTFDNGFSANATLNCIRKNEITHMSLNLNVSDKNYGQLNAEIQDGDIYFSYPLITDKTLVTDTIDLLGAENTTSMLSSLLAEIIYSEYFTSTQNGFDYSALYDTETDREIINFLFNFDLEDYLTPKELEKILTKYHSIWIDDFDNVSKVEDGYVARRDIYSVKETVIHMLEQLKNESFLYLVIEDLPLDGINEHTVSGVIDILIGKIDSGYDNYIQTEFGLKDGEKADLVYKIYVAAGGQITGREYHIEGDKSTEKIGYRISKTTDKMELTVFGGSVSVICSGTYENSVFSGLVTAKINEKTYNIDVESFSLIKAAGGVYPKMSAKVKGDSVFSISTDYSNGVTFHFEQDGLKLSISQKHGEGLTEDIDKYNAVDMDTWLASVDTEKFMELMEDVDEFIPPNDISTEPLVTTATTDVTTGVTDITVSSDTVTSTDTVTATDITTSVNVSDVATTTSSATQTPTVYSSGSLPITVNVPVGYNVSEEGGPLRIENTSEMVSIEESVYKFRNAKEISDLFSAAGFGKITETLDDSSVGGQSAYRVIFVDDNNRTVYIYYVPSKNITVTVIAGDNSPLHAVQTLIEFK